jgi:hypothetical protein
MKLITLPVVDYRSGREDILASVHLRHLPGACLCLVPALVPRLIILFQDEKDPNKSVITHTCIVMVPYVCLCLSMLETYAFDFDVRLDVFHVTCD